MDNCCSDERTQTSYRYKFTKLILHCWYEGGLLRIKLFSQMVSSLVSWLGGLLGQGETVEWLLSGLLLIHLLVILFFVFSRGNASAFLQWVLNRLPELEPEAMPGWSSEWCHPAAGLSSFHHPLHYLLEGFSSAVFPPLLVWRRARATVKDGSKDISRWKIMACLI